MGVGVGWLWGGGQRERRDKEAEELFAEASVCSLMVSILFNKVESTQLMWLVGRGWV